MRAPVQKKRLRRAGKRTAPTGGPHHTPGTTAGAPTGPSGLSGPSGPATAPAATPPGGPSAAPSIVPSALPPAAPPVGRGRPTHVRNRLIIAVTVVAAAIAAAGTPAVLAASGQLSDTQDLVVLAGQAQSALTLAHSLADERDEVTSFVAAGRPESKAPNEQHSVRVDRQVSELRADPDIPAGLRADLDAVATVRRSALTGKSGALEAHQAYSHAIAELHRLAEDLAEQQPPRAGSGAHALADLDTAVQQAAATRGLLLAALSVPTTTETTYDPITGLATETTVSSEADTKVRDALTAAAQQARLRSDAALAGFRETAPDSAKSSYDSTLTGTEVNDADQYLADLTGSSSFGDAELGTDPQELDAALSARIELMRGVESALYERRTTALETLRDDDVTALEIRVALLGALMLLAVGIATAMARTLTRPLAVLRLGSARLAEAEDPRAAEAVKFTGRNDEFARVVRSVNALHAQAVALHERIATLESDRKHLVAQRQRMADAREQLRGELDESLAALERLRGSIGGTFVNLSLRTLGLVERQLAVIEALEEREDDPDRLATLFKLDHFATVMRRHSENLLVLAGTEHVQHTAGPVPLVDVVRAAVSEIERYERIRIAALPPHAQLAGFAADDLSHLLAELMENATTVSPPEIPVEVSGWLLENGEVMLSVQDEGIGMTEERMTRLNARLGAFDPESPYEREGDDGLGLGLYVVARLAQRHQVRVQLRDQKQGGIAAVVVLPKSLLVTGGPAAVPAPAPAVDATGTFTLPGADAEANSNRLHGRSGAQDPLVALAEKAVAAAHPEEVRAPEPEPEPVQGSVPEPGVPADPEPGSDPEPAPERHAEPAPEPLPVRKVARQPSPAETTMELLAPEPLDDPSEPEPEPEPFEPVSVPAQGAVAPGAVAPGAVAPVAVAPVAVAAPDPYAIGPDTHERAPDERPHAEPEEAVTEKGLPKRTPRISAPQAAPRPRVSSVDAEALRRRLGGFRRGAEAGLRDVRAEIAEETARTRAAHAVPTAHAEAEESTGGTVEEASS
ncbi:nitrate- and nitrite sensing domain-containing protein [Streptomyces sp. NPDC093252]|uniref:nitrate- and nitrite sensing domain-containing protein n=1 Tax=Streptomyces sp. NPDC093252 TaxID=3154980 RepID=UPI003438A35F